MADLYCDFYGDLFGDTFVATNFLISLFLFFPLYDFNLILLGSQRASQWASLAKGWAGRTDRPPRPPWLRACYLSEFSGSLSRFTRELI